MFEPWIIPVGILLAFAAFLVAPLVEVAFAGAGRARFRCPFVGKEVTVDYGERSVLGIIAPTDVIACSALVDPSRPACGRGCLGPVPSAVSWSDRTIRHGQIASRTGHNGASEP